MLCCGARYDMVLTLQRHTSYKATTRNGREVVKHRYAMTDREGTRYVASGSYVAGFYVGKRYKIKATVKRYDADYNQWRLMRLAMVREDTEDGLL